MGLGLDAKPKKNGFIIHRGLNLSHWLSQTNKRGAEREAFMQAADFKAIADAGFDYVRLPVDEMHLWDEDGIRQAEAFVLLHQGVQWAIENDMRIIVDLHVLRSHHFVGDNQRLWNDPKAQEQFWGFWSQISDELKKYSNDKVAYELLNEAVAEDSEDWNKLITKGIETIREKEPKRTIVLGSNKWQQVYTFKDLKVPANDPNLILSFHFYEPFIITHYKTSWNEVGKYTGEVNYPGYPVDKEIIPTLNKELAATIKNENNYYDKNEMEAHILLAKKVADKHGLPLICGEFGCYPTTPMELRQRLFTDWISIFNKYNIAWCHWDYKGGFAAFDAKTQKPIPEITDILLKKDL